MNAHLLSFATEMVKLAEQGSEKRRSYLAAMGASVPLVAGKSLVEIPKGALDKGTEVATRRAFKLPVPPGRIVDTGLGRGLGTLGAGVLTTPLFLSGIQDMKSEDSKTRKRGAAKVVGASFAFTGARGAAEAAVSGAGGRLTRAEILRKVKDLAGSRALVGVGGGLLTARAVAAGSKNEKGGKKYILPAAVGAAAGAGKGAFDVAWPHLSRGRVKDLVSSRALKEMTSGAAGRAVGGSVGGALTALVFSKLMGNKGKEKKASVQQSDPVYFGPTSSELYDQVRAWGETAKEDELKAQYSGTRMLTEPEGTPTRRAVYYGLHDAMKSRGLPVVPTQQRDQAAPKQVRNPTLVAAASLAAVAVAPQVVWGLGVGTVSDTEADRVLLDSLDRYRSSKGIERMQAGMDFWGRVDFSKEANNPFYLFMGEHADDDARAILRSAEKAETAEALQFLGKYQAGAREFISAPRNVRPEALAHELGHAAAGPLRRGLLSSPVVSVVAAASTIPAIALPLFALEGASDSSFTTPEDLRGRARFSEKVGAVVLALKAPQLLEEGLASAKAVSLLERVGASKGEALLRSAKVLGVPFYSYAMPALFPFVVSAYLRHRARKAQ